MSSKYVYANSISIKGHLSYGGKVECSFSPFKLEKKIKGTGQLALFKGTKLKVAPETTLPYHLQA